MGETRVDLQHLLEDLRDAYPGSLEETILTEIMANALDSGSTQISFTDLPYQAATPPSSPPPPTGSGEDCGPFQITSPASRWPRPPAA